MATTDVLIEAVWRQQTIFDVPGDTRLVVAVSSEPPVQGEATQPLYPGPHKVDAAVERPYLQSGDFFLDY